MKKSIDEISIENLSHFIKTPLAIITGYCDIVNDGMAGEINAEQKEYISKIKNEVAKVDDFLNIFIDNVEKSFKEEFEKRFDVNLVDTLKELFMIIYSQSEKNRVFPDFIMPDIDIILNVDEQFDKAFMLVLREFIKIMNKDQFLKLEIDSKKNNITIWADKNNLKTDILSLKSNFLFITGKVMLETVGLKVVIKDNRIIIFYG
ncbi:MAG: hypothetical protein M0R46_17085 [Candidatus Muirbacterium halophilum]|nr:hypothetical protein [Candidatus Muirbacterium halophilum]MCK9477633.1 hypothetical protein [Candidatus Muirbacterium halophilum]